MPCDDRTAPEKPGVIFRSVCGEPRALVSAKTDEAGQPVHEECYPCKLRKEQRASHRQSDLLRFPASRFGIVARQYPLFQFYRLRNKQRRGSIKSVAVSRSFSASR